METIEEPISTSECFKTIHIVKKSVLLLICVLERVNTSGHWRSH